MKRVATLPTARGRPREFDPDDAVVCAMEAFWTAGYHGTTLPDLLDATQVSRGSLYTVFGDKHGLFLRALDRYIDESLARLDRELDTGRSAMAGLKACLSGYVDRTSGASGRRGCLMVATAMELCAQDAEVEQRLRRLFTAMETRLSETIARGQASDELAGWIAPATAARLFLCMLTGMRVVGKIGPDRAATQAMVDALLEQIAI